MGNTKQRITFKASNRRAFILLIVPLLLCITGVTLTFGDSFIVYSFGTLFLSFFFLQTFILLHECGHLNFFKGRKLNVWWGNVFGFLSVIPFYNWKNMHKLHHRWTGWRDKDPTTEKTVEPSESPFMRITGNIAWRISFPIFYLFYKISNYWNLFKIKRFLKKNQYRKARNNVAIYLLVYTLLAVFFGKFILVHLIPGFVLSLLWKELVILTQHSHIEIPVSNGEEVKPVRFADQVKFSRSFILHPFLSKYLLFHFNLHEAHHAYPGMPAYWLDKVEIESINSIPFSNWLIKAKLMKAEDYIFRTSKHTGEKF